MGLKIKKVAKYDLQQINKYEIEIEKLKSNI